MSDAWAGVHGWFCAPQVNFHTTLSGQSMVTLIYHRKLNKAWEEEARLLQNALAAVPGATATPSVIGRSRWGSRGPYFCGRMHSLRSPWFFMGLVGLEGLL